MDDDRWIAFQPDRRYLPGELTAIASKQTLARWRHEGKGPAYLKVGGRIAYPGEALNDWLERCTVRPTR